MLDCRKKGLCEGHINGVQGLGAIKGQPGYPCSGIKSGGYQRVCHDESPALFGRSEDQNPAS